MRDKPYMLSADRDLPPSGWTKTESRKPQDTVPFRDVFIQKHEPELNIPYDKSWQDGRPGHE